MTIIECRAPIPGTFYRCPTPGAPPFKELGALVSRGETVGLVEVMKSFTEVTAEHSGRIVRFLVEDQDAVMAGEPLYQIEFASKESAP